MNAIRSDGTKTSPNEASGAMWELAGVDVEAEYRINFYRLVAAKYWTELPAG